MARLRDPQNGCPWDIEQTFATIAPYTIEEAYEVADAIQHGDLDELRDELGDLLFQVVFYARMAKEADAFSFEDIVGGICDKMLRRHPHVFGSEAERAAGLREGSWERIKAEERRGDGGALAGVAGTVQALAFHHKLVPSVSGGYGFLAILVVLLAGFRAVWTAPIALFFAAVLVGSTQLSLRLDIDSSLAGVMQGMLVLFILLVGGWQARRTPVSGDDTLEVTPPARPPRAAPTSSTSARRRSAMPLLM